ncbi:hypothetical protein EVAR_46138_1 [Eumeta japonica]|uniref:Uncharacterized protein n=1 Tax=Eumeta variegata TaxID=151549 RepID=A0A4C1XP62_EUMVA|nr:hypothetical protein EVAR_46138_1 [Eumeta japonica]
MLIATQLQPTAANARTQSDFGCTPLTTPTGLSQAQCQQLNVMSPNSGVIFVTLSLQPNRCTRACAFKVLL